MAPASYESAGKRRPAGTRHGSPYLRRTLIEAARAAARTKGSCYALQDSRIARRRGPNKTAVAVAHSMLETAWHLLTTGALYRAPGADSFERRHEPGVEAKRLQRRIKVLGFAVIVTEKAAWTRPFDNSRHPGTIGASRRAPTFHCGIHISPEMLRAERARFVIAT